MHGWDGGWHMGWWMIWWWILGVALVVLVFRLLVGAGRGPTDGRPSRDSAEEILKRRYASGEIDRETYQRMAADLRGERQPPGGGRPPGSSETQHPV